MHWSLISSRLGLLTVASRKEGVVSVAFGDRVPDGGVVRPGTNRRAIRQLGEYLRGGCRDFDLPLALEGTPFELSVWRELLRIPYGETRSYGEIARTLGKPRAARAVGQASHRNPIAIVVPCHRVVGHDGSLTGYASGLRLKESLLALERASVGRRPEPVASRQTRPQGHPEPVRPCVGSPGQRHPLD